jgi:hypothetical protein
MLRAIIASRSTCNSGPMVGKPYLGELGNAALSSTGNQELLRTDNASLQDDLPVPSRWLLPRRQFIRVLGGVVVLDANDIQVTGTSSRQAPGHYRQDGEVDWRLVRSDFLFVTFGPAARETL